MKFSNGFYFVLETFTTRFSLCALVVISVYFIWCMKRENLPPGPIGLPFVGYLPFLGSEAHKILHKLTEKYGPIYSLYLGRKLVIVLGNFNVVKEALTNNNIMDRPEHPPNHMLPNSRSLSVCSGKVWVEQRKFSFQLLRQLGMAKIKSEEQILNEIQKLTFEIDKTNGKSMNLDAILYSSVSNNILRLLIGRTLDYNDKDRIFLDKTLRTMTLFNKPTRIHAYYPWLKKWMSKWKIWGYDKAGYVMRHLEIYIEDQVEKHKTNLDELSARDYIEGYLKFMKSLKDTDSTFSEKMLKGNFQSIFGAGSVPSTTALEWSIVSMIQYPDVQKAVHQELDTVLGPERPPRWSDHVNLPYTLAVIYEAMRQYPVAPISVLRCTSTRTKIAEYDIPKSTIVMTNIWGVHHDSESWEDPFAFKPERFIRKGNIFRPREFIPFSYGKRNCPGEDMAIMTVFLYFASLMQRYEISLPDTNCDVKQVIGIARLVILDNIQMNIRN